MLAEAALPIVIAKKKKPMYIVPFLKKIMSGLFSEFSQQENWALPTVKILCHLPKIGQSANIFFADRF